MTGSLAGVVVVAAAAVVAAAVAVVVAAGVGAAAAAAGSASGASAAEEETLPKIQRRGHWLQSAGVQREAHRASGAATASAGGMTFLRVLKSPELSAECEHGGQG